MKTKFVARVRINVEYGISYETKGIRDVDHDAFLYYPLRFRRTMYLFAHLLPLFKFLLPLLTVVERKDIREQTAGDLFDFVFGDIGFIDEFLFFWPSGPP